MFDGHKFYVIEKTYVFDITDFKLYRIIIDKNGEPIDKLFVSNIVEKNGRYFVEHKNVSIKIRHRISSIISKYKKEALLEDE